MCKKINKDLTDSLNNLEVESELINLELSTLDQEYLLELIRLINTSDNINTH